MRWLVVGCLTWTLVAASPLAAAPAIEDVADDGSKRVTFDFLGLPDVGASQDFDFGQTGVSTRVGLFDFRESLSVGGISGRRVDTLFGTVDTRTGARVTLTGEVSAGLTFDAGLDFGGAGIDLAYGVGPQLDVPRIATGRPFSLGATAGVRAGSVAIDYPSVVLDSDLVLELAVDVDGAVAIPVIEPYNPFSFGFDLLDFQAPLFSLDWDLDAPDLDLGFDLPDVFELSNVPDDVLKAFRIPTAPATQLAEFQVLDPRTWKDDVAFQVAPDGNSVTASVEGGLVRLLADLDGLAATALGAPPVSEGTLSAGPISIEYRNFDVKYGPELGFRYSVTVEPELLVDLDFDRQVGFVDPASGNARRTTGFTEASFRELPRLLLLDTAEVGVDATFTGIRTRLVHDFDLVLDDFLRLEALTYKARVLKFALKEVGPVVSINRSLLRSFPFDLFDAVTPLPDVSLGGPGLLEDNRFAFTLSSTPRGFIYWTSNQSGLENDLTSIDQWAYLDPREIPEGRDSARLLSGSGGDTFAGKILVFGTRGPGVLEPADPAAPFEDLTPLDFTADIREREFVFGRADGVMLLPGGTARFSGSLRDEFTDGFNDDFENVTYYDPTTVILDSPVIENDGLLVLGEKPSDQVRLGGSGFLLSLFGAGTTEIRAGELTMDSDLVVVGADHTLRFAASDPAARARPTIDDRNLLPGAPFALRRVEAATDFTNQGLVSVETTARTNRTEWTPGLAPIVSEPEERFQLEAVRIVSPRLVNTETGRIRVTRASGEPVSANDFPDLWISSPAFGAPLEIVQDGLVAVDHGRMLVDTRAPFGGVTLLSEEPRRRGAWSVENEGELLFRDPVALGAGVGQQFFAFDAGSRIAFERGLETPAGAEVEVFVGDGARVEVLSPSGSGDAARLDGLLAVEEGGTLLFEGLSPVSPGGLAVDNRGLVVLRNGAHSFVGGPEDDSLLVSNRGTFRVENTADVPTSLSTNVLASRFTDQGAVLDAGRLEVVGRALVPGGSVSLFGGASLDLRMQVPRNVADAAIDPSGLDDNPVNPALHANASSILLSGDASIPALSTLEVNLGELALDRGARFTTAGDWTNMDARLAVGTDSRFEVQGALLSAMSQVEVEAGGALDFSGGAEILGGSLVSRGAVSGYDRAASTLQAGRSWRVADVSEVDESGAIVVHPGLLDLGGDVAVNEADLTLAGAEAAVSGLEALHANRGSLALLEGASLNAASTLAFLNEGAISIGLGSTLALGHEQVAFGAGSTLSVEGDGALEIGFGDLVLDDDAVVTMILSEKTAASEAFQIQVAGDAVLAGTLRLLFDEESLPAFSRDFELFQFGGGVTGGFSSVELAGRDGTPFDPDDARAAEDLFLGGVGGLPLFLSQADLAAGRVAVYTPVPEPGTAAALGLGLALLARTRRGPGPRHARGGGEGGARGGPARGATPS